jgi:hypothetical protein
LAKLKLKNVVDVEEATETMESFNMILLHFKQTAVISKNPRNVTYIECVSILEGSKFPFSFEETVRSACQRNEQVKRYIGDKYTLEYNFKLRPILDLLIKNIHIDQVNQKPIALRWITNPKESNIKVNHPSDASKAGVCDGNKKSLSNKEGKNKNESVSSTSDTSDMRYICSEEPSSNTQSPLSIHTHTPIVTVQEFFRVHPDVPYEYQTLPPHSLEQSPCYPIISKKGGFYRCKVHPKEQNIYLETIEHHCKYKDPELHKSEIIRLTSTTATTAEAAAAEAVTKNILYAAFQVSQKQAFHNSNNRI